MQRNFALPGRSPVLAQTCAVSTSHPLATATALAVLKEGGNAVDAAIAASATLSVVEPHMTGVGGDCFAIVADPQGVLHGLNGSGRSARGAHLDWYLENGFSEIPEESAHSVTVPGAVNAWETLHQKFGSMDFVRLFAEAIRYADNGFPVAPRVASDWAGNADKLAANEGGALHCLFDGQAPQVGQVVKFPALAKTLKTIAKGGANAFYQGDIAREIAETVQSAGGFLSEEDIAGVSADWVELISTEYRGHVLHEIPPNGQGLAALILVNLLKKIGISENPDDLKRAHLEAECGRIAYTARDAYISDPQTMSHSVEALLSDDHIDALCKLYDPEKRNENILLPDPTGSDTVYLTVVDRDGMAVSFINSLFAWFGSGIITKDSGIALQSRGAGFNVIPGHGNAIGPSKRPFHTIIPAMVTKQGKVTHSYGVMGGAYQAMGHAHVLSNMLDYEMDPQQALDHSRIFWGDSGDLELEDSIADGIQNGLEGLGHRCSRGAVHGGGQVIQIDHDNGVLIAGSDPRKDGHSAGF
ncbi:MAG: gamma-glutamyltransferase family protein [Pseudomonadota bacterium]